MSAPTLPTSKSPNNWLSTSTSGATLAGTAGKSNQISANTGRVTLVGSTNSDNTFIVYDTSDKIVQAAGTAVDTVETWGSGYILPTNVQNLTLEGSNNAYGIGNSMNNLLVGNSGSDTFTTGGGNDVIIDGSGSDTINITKQTGSVTWVENFKTSGTTADKLNLSQYFTSLTAVKAATTQVGSDLQINLGNGQSVMLQNTSAASLSATNVQTGVNLSAMHMTFDEEFSGKLTFGNGTLNTGENTWNTTYGGGTRTLVGNNEQELYVDPNYKGLGLDPFSMNNGVMTIQANKTPSADVSALGGYQYTSGVLTTQGSFAQQYGYFEVGAETPAGQGLWPAFWLLPANGSWPPELDVFEQVNNVAGSPTTSYSTTHSKVVATVSDAIQMPTDLTAGFHTYGMNWDANNITYYIDGQQVAQMATPSDAKQPMYMLLDLAVGGSWPGSPDATTNWSTAQMKIDYVHAYSSDPSLPTVNNTGNTTSTASTGTTGTTSTASGSGTTTGVASTGTTTTGTTGTSTTATGTTGTVASGTTTGTTATGTTTTATGTTSTGTTSTAALPNSTVVTVAASASLSNDASATKPANSFAAAVTKGGVASATYTAAQMGAGDAGTTVTVAYDQYNNVSVTNNGKWGAIKDVTIKDAHATGITLNNFVDTEVTTAGAGAAYVNINGVMRGNIKLGDGANVLNITGGSNSTTGNGVNINTGLGGSKVNFTGTANDMVSLRTGNGTNTINVNGQAYGTVIVGSGNNNQINDNTTGALQIYLGSGSSVMDFLAGAHATVSNFNTSTDKIVLQGVTASQVKVTATGGSTDIAINGGGTIHVAGANLTTHMSQITYA